MDLNSGGTGIKDERCSKPQTSRAFDSRVVRLQRLFYFSHESILAAKGVPALIGRRMVPSEEAMLERT